MALSLHPSPDRLAGSGKKKTAGEVARVNPLFGVGRDAKQSIKFIQNHEEIEAERGGEIW